MTQEKVIEDISMFVGTFWTDRTSWKKSHHERDTQGNVSLLIDLDLCSSGLKWVFIWEGDEVGRQRPEYVQPCMTCKEVWVWSRL